MRGALRDWGGTRAYFRYGNLARLTDTKRKTSLSVPAAEECRSDDRRHLAVKWPISKAVSPPQCISDSGWIATMTVLVAL